MASNGDDGPTNTQRRPQRPGFLPPGLVELVVPPLKVGVYSGTAGVLAGVGGAIARDTSPVVSGVFSGVQWFMLGSSYWFTRSVGIKVYGGEDKMTSIDKVGVSGLAGSTAGAVAGLARGPSRLLPAMVIWGLVGAGGQAIANSAFASQASKNNDGSSWLSKLSPLKRLTDEEYIDMMKEKILKVDVDIALIDDRIAELKAADKANGLERQIENTPRR
ncbi:beta-ketoacyl synthase [Pochonia chlamydosporia 170]|uniref:Beta-ketoacyl synthase n=1 Tax=Pochonia chlamydosporia 170 TaxID=1380566 RepID=A0A179FAR9_METCM|nr:beta-ketoacyl synthase [Pochonia chlamydosporia 170]OAQ62400.1 beta-ketoacyl synthase [Pochonia chlamydosporia 170]